MKLLHTSDWHLGQCLNQYERQYEHAQFLAWLLDTLVSEQADALLIAGDVFDTTNPSSAAQNQLYQFLTQARQRMPQWRIVMTAGNHDSPGRMEAPAPFLALLDACVVGQTGRIGDAIDLQRLVVPLHNAQGDVAAWCIAMPFLRPSDLPRVEGAEDPYLAGVAAVYAQAYAYAQSRRTAGQAIVAMGHCHITGGQISADSERRIVIGGAESLSAALFDPGIAYVALGHLHLAQQVGGDATRRYCGSPLPLSFSELNYPHQVVLVELDGEQVAAVRALRVPRSVELLRIPPKPAPLPDVLAALAALQLPRAADGEPLPQAQWPYLQVRVALDQPEPSLRATLEAALMHQPVRLVRIETSNRRSGEDLPSPALSLDTLRQLEPAAYFERLYQHHHGNAPSAALLSAFSELLNQSNEAGVTP